MRSGFQRIAAGSHLPRHRHREAHITLVLSGSYDEAGDEGRFRAEPGHVLVHHAFGAHCNRMDRQGVEVMNLLLLRPPGYAVGRCEEAGRVARLAERDLGSAAEALLAWTMPQPVATASWLDRIARSLRSGSDSLSQLAEAEDISASHLSRAFKEAFGVSPKRYRADARSLSAWRAIISTDAPLAQIAADHGFADQSHMTRAVVELTGMSPARWRQHQPT